MRMIFPRSIQFFAITLTALGGLVPILIQILRPWNRATLELGLVAACGETAKPEVPLPV